MNTQESSNETSREAGVTTTEGGAPAPTTEASATGSGTAEEGSGGSGLGEESNAEGSRSETDTNGNTSASAGVFTPHDSPNPTDKPKAEEHGGLGGAEAPEAREGEAVVQDPTAATPEVIVDASLDDAELDDLNRQLDEAQATTRSPGALPPGVDARDPLESMAQLPVEPTADYVNWLEGLVAHYREYATQLRATCRRAGHATDGLPHYPDYAGR